MGARKKGKTNKLSKMSEEEKIRYLQHRAAAEEEVKRRKEQLISTFLKNKLYKEQTFSRLNISKINQQWMHNLRQIKCVELRQDLEDMLKWFDYIMNKKNEIIETLLENLEEAENQFSRIHQCQMETVDKLIKIHEQRINRFSQQYKKEKEEFYNKSIVDINDILQNYINDEEQLQASLYCMNKAHKEKTDTLTTRQSLRMDEVRNNMLTDLENLKNFKESEIEKLWCKFEEILRMYWEQTEDRRREYLMMKDCDRQNCHQIFNNNHQIKEVINTILNLKDQLAKLQEKSHLKIESKKAEREICKKFFNLIKASFLEEVENDKKNLSLLNVTADMATNELKKILDKGKEIQQLQMFCKKLETVNDKVSIDNKEKLQLLDKEEEEIRNQSKIYMESLAEKAGIYIGDLDNFWKRFNEAYLEKEALVIYNQSLLNEQKHLKLALRKYFTDYVVKKPESKVSYANGVKFSHLRTSTSLPIPKNTTPFSTITCIEATQSPSIRQMIISEKEKQY